ncbi:MAG: hypothetical protein NC123_03170 [Butyrivibrio sp.]|nr:hypothetical protein [Acetatifactor muris]MCM1558542.1 hypothetical protein [Butyrivibrio sp.]
MNQKEPMKGSYILGCGIFFVLALGIMYGVLPSPSSGGVQKQKEAEASAPAEESQELTLHEAAEQIEGVDNDAPMEQDGFKLRKVTRYSYDSRGQCTAIDEYDSFGILSEYRHYTYDYDAQGNCILEESTSSATGWGSGKEVCVCTYDEENRLILEQDYDGDVLRSEYYFRYMPDQTTYSVVQNYDEEGRKSTWSTTIFNENDDPVCEYYYDVEGQVTRCGMYRYDEEGRQIYYICYNNGDENTRPLREVITEYGEEQTVRLSYEPLGHLNSVHYLNIDGNASAELYYLAGYSGENGIRILGQEEPVWNQELKFWEGIWRTYNGEDIISDLNCGSYNLYSYSACWYEEGKKVRELTCSVNSEGVGRTRMHFYVYNEDGVQIECSEYEFSGESLEEELQDGTRIRLEYDGHRIRRLLCTDTAGNILREITVETETGRSGRIREWYEAEEWPEMLISTENGIVPAEQIDGGEQNDV